MISTTSQSRTMTTNFQRPKIRSERYVCVSHIRSHNAISTPIGDQRPVSKTSTKPASKKATKPASGRAKKAKVVHDEEED